MKKVTILTVALLTLSLMFASCGSKKQVAQTTVTNTSQNNPLGEEIDLPCVYESQDDDYYFRDMGTATAVNMQSARTAALQAAQSMIWQKLGGYVEGLVEDYSRSMAGQATQEKVQRLMESDLNKVVQEKVNHAQKTCEKMYNKGVDGYTSFIAIQIPVKKLIEDMSNALSQDEELEIEFNRERFRKYAEEKAAKMVESRKAKYGK